MKRFYYIFIFIMILCLNSCTNSNIKHDDTYHWEVSENGEIINKEKHKLNEWTVIKESTCIVPGTKQRKCTGCSYKETKELELEEHEEVVTKKGIPATFYEEGIYDEIKCSKCNNIVQEQGVSPKLTSSYELVYELNEACDGYIVVGAYESSSTELLIGLEYEGLPIVEIASNAFRYHYWIKTIKIADNVKKIGSGAFEHCGSLERVELTKGLTVIEDKLFNSCESLKEVTLPEGITKIGESAFLYCKNLEKLEIPNTVKELGEFSFLNTRKLEKLTLPEGISVIPKACFDGSGIKQINIPSTVKKIEGGAFIGCSNLESIEIPANCEILENYAFNSCKNLKQVILHEGLQSIGQLCFSACTSLSEIVIPSSVTTIGPTAFKNIENLVINCKVELKPDGWDNEWADVNCIVNWNYKEE